MAGIMLTGAAGQGKTHAAVNHIKSLLQRSLFGKVWVLLPTELQISTFRTRLLHEIGDAAHFGVEFFDFYDLYARLLEIAGTPQRRVKGTARFRILRHVLTEEVGDHLTHFQHIAHMPGFVALLADFILELKQSIITPEEFAATAQSDKDSDLAAIYGGYQQLLRARDLVDRDGEGWLVLARMEDAASLDLNVDLLVVDGYDQFNPVQARLLGVLARHIPETLLTLTYEAERAETAHRRFAQTRSQLLNTGDWTEQILAADQSAGADRNKTLDYLSAHLFDMRPQAIPNDGALVLLEAPTLQREVQTVLRRVKRLLLDGVQAEQIAIVGRNLEPYTAYFLETAPAYGIPLAVRRGTPLRENPAVSAFLALVDLAKYDFRRRSVMDALYSPYLRCPDLSPYQIDKLDMLSRVRIVTKGRQNWLDAIRYSARSQVDEDGEPRRDTLPHDEAEELYTAAKRFFARITPRKTGTAREYTRWLESLIGADPVPYEEPTDEDQKRTYPSGFNVIERIRAATQPGIVARDLIAIECLKRVLLEVLSAYELVDPYTQVSWETYWLDLQTAVNNATINSARASNRLGRVLLASVYEARGLPHDHLFLIGLSEGVFPARAPENVLYTDDERRRLQAQNLPLLTRQEAADESSLFYEMTALARQTLTISRPYVDERGNEWPISPFWRAAQQIVQTEVERLPIALEIGLADAAYMTEATVALAQILGGKLTPTIGGVHNWILSQHNGAWANALRARKTEANRASRLSPHDAFTGRLTDPALLAMVAEQLGPERMWSASQFNEYGICPYRFFARRLLSLEALEEPEEGVDPLQLGLLYHKILEETYSQIDAEQLAISAENQARALEILRGVFDRILPDAPETYAFRATALWPHEQDILRRRLERLVRKDFSEDGPISQAMRGSGGQRYTVRQEVRFGVEDEPPLILDGAAGPLKIRGAIDRVDEVNGQAIVIDYKTGASSIPTTEMVEGRNVQMMLYISAARQLLADRHIAGGAFWHIGTQKLSGQIAADAGEIEEARDTLHRRILDGRQGIFVNVPSKRAQNGRCALYCEFRELCRVDQVGRNKELGIDT